MRRGWHGIGFPAEPICRSPASSPRKLGRASEHLKQARLAPRMATGQGGRSRHASRMVLPVFLAHLAALHLADHADRDIRHEGDGLGCLEAADAPLDVL